MDSQVFAFDILWPKPQKTMLQTHEKKFAWKFPTL